MSRDAHCELETGPCDDTDRCGGTVDWLEEQTEELAGWFAPDCLADVLGGGGTHAERLAIEWLARAGKRWRPLLAVCTHRALSPEDERSHLRQRRGLAVAVECFHKASLIHDDIEDDDAVRYGVATLAEEYGVPVALNVGDLLLGMGYELAGSLPVDETTRGRIVALAAQSHRRLCVGQGNELAWHLRRDPLSVDEVLGIFKDKTAPAFVLALQAAALAAGADDTLADPLAALGSHLGVAYQIADDLSDAAGGRDSDLCSVRPSIVAALAYERGDHADKEVLRDFWAQGPAVQLSEAVLDVLQRTEARQQSAELYRHYRQQSEAALADVTVTPLRDVLTALNDTILP